MREMKDRSVFMLRWISHSCFLLLLAASSGCGAGPVGLIWYLLSSESGDESEAANVAPARPFLQERIREGGGRVLLSYTLLDDRGGPLRLRAEYQPLAAGDSGDLSFAPASEYRRQVGETGPLSDGLENLQVEANAPRSFRFVWDARADLLRSPLKRPVARVRIRLTALEGSVESDPLLSEDFVAGNEAPRVLYLEPRSESGVVPLAVRVADSTSDPVELEVAWCIGNCPAGGPGFSPASLIRPGGSFESAPEEEGGREAVLFWDTRRDLGEIASSEVHLLISPRDADEGDPFEGVLSIDNNTEPVVQLLDPVLSTDRSFEVPLTFIARDAEGHPVSVVLQWASGSEPFPELPIPESLTRADVEELQALLSSDDPAQVERRAQFHVLSGAPRVLRGTLDGAGPDRREIREPDLLEGSLLFRPPTAFGPRGLPAPPFTAASDVFLIGQAIRFLDERGAPGPWLRIEEIDPRTATARLDGPPGARPGARFELMAQGRLTGLSSSPDGIAHSFIWDSLRDLPAAGLDLEGAVRLRAFAVDSQSGRPFPESTLRVQSRHLVQGPELPADLTPVHVASGDLNGDGLEDLVVTRQSARTALPRPQPSETWMATG
jgi:hypothetical protein